MTHSENENDHFDLDQYKYLIFIYSEQMTHSENENDHFDLDHFDHILATPFFLSCSSYVTLMLLLFEMGVYMGFA